MAGLTERAPRNAKIVRFAPLIVFVVTIGAVPWAEPRTPDTCPPGFVADDARSARVGELLARIGEPARASGDELLCFAKEAPSEGGVTQRGQLLVDAGRTDAAIAARVVHLRFHRHEPSMFHPPADAQSCPAWLERVLASEERARRLELDARSALAKVTPSGAPTYAGDETAEHADSLRRAYLARCLRGAAATAFR